MSHRRCAQVWSRPSPAPDPWAIMVAEQRAVALLDNLPSDLVPPSTGTRPKDGTRLLDLSEAEAFRMAASSPEKLLKRIRSGELTNVELTFAAEALGSAPKSEPVTETLDDLLRHASALVREGAIYGVSNYGLESFRGRLETLAADDPSAGVRAVAADALAE